MLFTQSTRKNPTEEPKTANNAAKTFIRFKNRKPGEWQTNHAVYRIKKKNDVFYNYLYIGNPYVIGLAEKTDNKPIGRPGILLQSNNGELYFVVHKEGRMSKPSNTWAVLEIRTLLFYVPKLNELLQPDEENELLFNISDNSEEFIAVGIGIDGIMFNGYKLTYVKKLHENTPIIKEIEQTSFSDFSKTNLDDMI